MKRLVFLLTAFLLMNSAAYALDGRVAFGKYLNQGRQAFPLDGQFSANYLSEVELGHALIFPDFSLRPFIGFYTLMDGVAEDSAGFHPSSIDFRAGLQVLLPKGFYIEYEHSCWHPIDNFGRVEEWDRVSVGWSFDLGGTKLWQR